MRYLAALLIAVTLIFLVFWVGAKIAVMVDPPHRAYNEYTVGRRMDLCGFAVDVRSDSDTVSVRSSRLFQGCGAGLESR